MLLPITRIPTGVTSVNSLVFSSILLQHFHVTQEQVVNIIILHSSQVAATSFLENIVQVLIQKFCMEGG